MKDNSRWVLVLTITMAAISIRSVDTSWSLLAGLGLLASVHLFAWRTLWPILPGSLANFTVCALNGGSMPVAPEYYENVHVMASLEHHELTMYTRLPHLADILWGGTSIGDWLLLAGLALVLIDPFKNSWCVPGGS